MMNVTIAINCNPLYTRTAVNITPDGRDYCEYKLDDGTIIKHKRSEGAKALAKKMIDTIEEVRHNA